MNHFRLYWYSNLVYLLCVCVPTSLGAQEPRIPLSVAGESYLDGFDIQTIMGMVVVPETTDDVASYLDDIEKELTALDADSFLVEIKGGMYKRLDDCLQDAMKRHMPLSIAQDKIELAKRKVIKAVRDLFPAFSVTYEHNRGFKLYKDDDDPTDGDDKSQQFRSQRIRYGLQQPLFRGGELWNTVRAERANLKVAKAEYKKVMQDLSVEVAKAYLNAMKARTMMQFKVALGSTVGAMIDTSKEKMDAGLISEVEHLNVQSQYSQVEQDVTVAREEQELSLLEFKKIMHISVEDQAHVGIITESMIADLKSEMSRHTDVTSQNIDVQNQKIAEVIKLAYQHRPEFSIRRFTVEAAEWNEKVSQSGWLPQINLVTEVGRKREAYMAMDNNPPWDDEHHIGIQFKWNLGGNTTSYDYDKDRQGTGVEATDRNTAQDGNYDRRNTVGVGVLDGLEQFSRTKEAEIKRKEAELEMELAEKDIVGEVKEAYYNYNRALVQLNSVFKKLEYREKLVELSRHRSEINEIQISEYIQAEMDLINERDGLYKALVDYYLAKVSLNKSVGIDRYVEVSSW